jgi:hypothetical protein
METVHLVMEMQIAAADCPAMVGTGSTTFNLNACTELVHLEEGAWWLEED